MNTLFRFSIAFLTLTTITALVAQADDGSDKSAPPRPIKAKVVDTPEIKAHPKPPEHPDWYYDRPEYAQSVQVHTAPTEGAPVFAHFAGGADVEVYGEPVERDGVVWSDVEFMGVRGWVPRDRLSTTSKEMTDERRWDIRFVSPSGKVVVEYVNRNSGSLHVIKDGTGREEYELDLGPEVQWSVGGMLFFSKEERCFALSYGGISYGTQVFVYGRKGRAPFKRLELNLQKRCWDLALKKKLIPTGAQRCHAYMELEKSLEQGFVVLFAGNYNGTGTGQTNFGPIRFTWTRKGDRLEVTK